MGWLGPNVIKLSAALNAGTRNSWKARSLLHTSSDAATCELTRGTAPHSPWQDDDVETKDGEEKEEKEKKD